MTSTKEVILDRDGASVVVYRGWYKEADVLYQKLVDEVKWESKEVVMYGKKVMQPRLIAYCGEKEIKHTYSGLTLDLPSYNKFPQGKEIKKIQDDINKLTGETYNSCLLNRYRDGKDYINYHSDKEGKKFINTVATLSLGGKRRFYLKAKDMKSPDVKTELKSGDLCLMLGKCQHLYTHSIPKQANVKGRISLTFRDLINSS